MPNLENLKKQAKLYQRWHRDGHYPVAARIRDGARLNLRHRVPALIEPAGREREDYLSATITLDDAKPLFIEFQAAGVAFHQALRTEPWGARTFIVRDPDGNLLLFAGQGE